MRSLLSVGCSSLSERRIPRRSALAGAMILQLPHDGSGAEREAREDEQRAADHRPDDRDTAAEENRSERAAGDHGKRDAGHAETATVTSHAAQHDSRLTSALKDWATNFSDSDIVR